MKNLLQKHNVSKVSKGNKKWLLWLYRLLKNFLWVQTTHTKYPRCRSEPGKCSAHWIMVIRRLEQKVRIENEKSSKIHLESGFDMRISICRIFSKFKRFQNFGFTKLILILFTKRWRDNFFQWKLWYCFFQIWNPGGLQEAFRSCILFWSFDFLSKSAEKRQIWPLWKPVPFLTLMEDTL